MSDLIKREDAIEAMEQKYQDILRIFKRKVKVGEKAIVSDMIGCIKSLPSADRPQEWIPCSERLPKDNREVLISLEWGIDIGTYERGEWRSEWINHYDDDNVLAWMPLPEPMKGADDE